MTALILTDANCKPELHNYHRAIMRLVASGRLTKGRVSGVEILHDDWCELLQRGGYCNCEPEVRLDGRVL
jgi:hypothetical protein